MHASMFIMTDSQQASAIYEKVQMSESGCNQLNPRYSQWEMSVT